MVYGGTPIARAGALTLQWTMHNSRHSEPAGLFRCELWCAMLPESDPPRLLIYPW